MPPRAPARARSIRPQRWQAVTAAVTASVVLLLGTTACGARPAELDELVSHDPLAGLVVRGGLCADGPCHREVQVTGAGHWTRSGLGATTVEGDLTQEQLAALHQALDETGLADAPTNTRPCATASDGSELVVTWAGSEAEHLASSCELVFPADDPLVVALESLLYGPAATAVG